MDSLPVKHASEDERVLVGYLLGRLPEAERSRIEEQIFANESLEEELRATADDLIHDYLGGGLSEADREFFETRFLASPANAERLRFIRDLGTAVEQVAREAGRTQEVPADAWQGLWPVAAGLACVAAGILLILTRPGTTRRANVALVPTSVPPSTVIAAPPTPSVEPRRAVVRVPVPQRAKTVRLAMTAETHVVRFELAVPDGPPSFDATLLAPDGTTAWRAENLSPPPPGRPLVLSMPAQALTADTYTLRVEGEPLRDSEAPMFVYRVLVSRER